MIQDIGWESLKDLQKSFGVPFKTYVDEAGNRYVFITEGGVIFRGLLKGKELDEFISNYYHICNLPNTPIEPYSRALEVRQRLVPKNYLLFVSCSYFDFKTQEVDVGSDFWKINLISDSGKDGNNRVFFDFCIPEGFYFEGIECTFKSDDIQNICIKEISIYPDSANKAVILENKKLILPEVSFKYESPGSPKFLKNLHTNNMDLVDRSNTVRFDIFYHKDSTGMIELTVKTYKKITPRIKE